jgi:hypothetical protein
MMVFLLTLKSGRKIVKPLSILNKFVVIGTNFQTRLVQLRKALPELDIVDWEMTEDSVDLEQERQG